MANAERNAQQSFWREHSEEPTLQQMMLDSKAEKLDERDRPEVMRALGSVEGKTVLELGAGIGRFTGQLAASAGKVVAVDFMDSFMAENRKAHSELGNVEFRVADVLDLQLQDGECDVIFSNWLLMYLGDEEVSALARRCLQWLNDDGILFFRESCFCQSGDVPRSKNPTHYRTPQHYFEFFEGARLDLPGGKTAYFELLHSKCIDAYVELKHNQNQICWKWRKVVTQLPPEVQFRHFLDNNQYTNAGILKYERIFGPGYVSTGGVSTTREMVGLMGLRPGQKVLDIGCGIGGGDFYMAKECGVHVHGLDLSVNMVLIALQRAVEQGGGGDVTFEIADCTTREFPDASFDAVYSRDALLHISDKPALFARMFKWLKPGGKVLITDYCRSPSPPSPDFAAYIAQRGYDLHSVDAYGAMLEAAGFTHVRAEDRTAQFVSCLESELARFKGEKDAFVSEFSHQDYEYLVKGWLDKLQRSGGEGAEQRWGLFLATKPEEEAAACGGRQAGVEAALRRA